MTDTFAKLRDHLAVEDLDGVRRFFLALLDAGVNFHPDTRADTIGSKEEPPKDRSKTTDREGRLVYSATGQAVFPGPTGTYQWVRTFTDGEAALVDAAMGRCFEACDAATERWGADHPGACDKAYRSAADRLEVYAVACEVWDAWQDKRVPSEWRGAESDRVLEPLREDGMG